jgi:hypothetical protein
VKSPLSRAIAASSNVPANKGGCDQCDTVRQCCGACRTDAIRARGVNCTRHAGGGGCAKLLTVGLRCANSAHPTLPTRRVRARQPSGNGSHNQQLISHALAVIAEAQEVDAASAFSGLYGKIFVLPIASYWQVLGGFSGISGIWFNNLERLFATRC